MISMQGMDEAIQQIANLIQTTNCVDVPYRASFFSKDEFFKGNDGIGVQDLFFNK